jgi:hypothetical protein
MQRQGEARGSCQLQTTLVIVKKANIGKRIAEIRTLRMAENRIL